MVVKIAGLGRSFGGLAAYCLHDRREPGEPQPESAERVEWTETRNLPTSRGDRAAAMMAATAEAAPDLKRLAGQSAAGRKLENPVCHYSLSWAKDEAPGRQEMSQAVGESLKALGLEQHQALIVAHGDGHPHVHVIVNRVDPETGKAAPLRRSKLRLSKWAQEYEERQGRVRCGWRVHNNFRRGRGKPARDRVSLPTGRHRRERMNPHPEPRQKIAAAPIGQARERVAWQRAEESLRWAEIDRVRGQKLGELGQRARREWAQVYGWQGQQREQLAKDGRGVVGRLRRWRQGGKLRGLGGALRGSTEVLRRWREELEHRHRRERVLLARVHSREARTLEREVGDAYRRGMEGSEARAEAAVGAERAGLNGSFHYDDLPGGGGWGLRVAVGHERMEQLREVEGEAAYADYQARRQAVERLSQSPPVRPQQRGPERGGPDRDYGPSR